MDLNNLVCENQSIKIVPSIEESLRSTGLDVNLSEDSLRWFSQLVNIWKTWRKSAAVEQNIEQFFSCVPDPHRVVLLFVIKSDDFKDCKPKSLPYYLVETLQNWSQKKQILPENSVKLPAYQIASQQRNSIFFNLVAVTYQLSTIKEEILPSVKVMIEEGNYKNALQIVMALSLFDDISMEELLFPLVLQDKVNLIDDYLTQCPTQVHPFLSYLDGFLVKSSEYKKYALNYIEKHKITEIKYDKIHCKPLGKFVARLCNKFKIPIETCTNLSKNRTTGGLKYLVYQKYMENNVSSAVWDDLVKDSLKKCGESAFEFIDLLTTYDQKEALKWAQYLNMPVSKYPPGLSSLPQNQTDKNEDTENWDQEVMDKKMYYKLSIPLKNIIIIDNGEKFHNMITEFAHSKVVSIDCEWKPSFATRSPVALIQIARQDKVFLIDTMVLNKEEFLGLWSKFYKLLLDNAEIIKVGFGLEQDLREIKASIIGLNNVQVKGEGLLDLSLLWKSLIGNGLVMPGGTDNSGHSLSSLVQSCFGLPLGKDEQCSNWELRPLRQTQIEYAALDAHVLMEIFGLLQNLCLSQDIQFEEVCNNIMSGGKVKSVKKTKVCDRIKASVTSPTKSVRDIRFLVDPQLTNLISYFRYCGIDTISMPPVLPWHEIVYLAISEDRCILVPKIKYTPTANYPQTSIFEVKFYGIKEQIEKVISNFNVCVKNADLLSRCIYCNETQLSKLSYSEVQKICSDANKSASVQMNKSCDDNNGYDNFLSDSDDDGELYQPDLRQEKIKSNEVKTSLGVPIQVHDIDEIVKENKSVVLCQSCGKLLWDNDEVVRPVCDLVQKLTNLSVI